MSESKITPMKLELNKQLITQFSRLNSINNHLAPENYKCFENLWTFYYCDVIDSHLTPEVPGDEHQQFVIRHLEF